MKHLVSRSYSINHVEDLFVDHLAGSSIKYVLITQEVAQRKREPHRFARGQQHKFHALIAAEEEEYDAQLRKEKGTRDGPDRSKGESHESFEEYREKTKRAGAM